MRQQELMRMLLRQTQGVAVVNQGHAQVAHVPAPNTVQHQTGPAPAVQLPIAPSVQQRQIEPEVIFITSRSPSPNRQARTIQANEEPSSLHGTQTSPRSSLNENGKREAEAEPEPEVDGEDIEDGLEDFMAQHWEQKSAGEARVKKEERRAERLAEDDADKLFYEQNPEMVDRIYLGLADGTNAGDGNRKRKDPYYLKMAVYKAHLEKKMGKKATKKQDTPFASKPPPAAQKPKAKRQKMNYEEPQKAGSAGKPSSLDRAQASEADQIVSQATNGPEAQSGEALPLPQTLAVASSIPESPRGPISSSN